MQTLILIAALGFAQEPPLQIPPPTPPAPVEAPQPAPKPAAPTPPLKPATPSQAPVPAAASASPALATSLTYYSDSFTFTWDRIIPLSINLDGLKVSSIFFNKRVIESGVFGLFKDAEFGTRARVEVTNAGTFPKMPGFAVAVVDKEGRLLGVASGGTKVGTIKPGETETFDLNFTQVKERLAFGDKFFLAIELRH